MVGSPQATPSLPRRGRSVHPALFAFATGVGLMTDKYILGATNFVEWSFKPVGVEKDIDKAASLLFAVVGMMVFGPLSDLLGRRTCMLLTSAITVMGALGSACAMNEWMLIGFRMLTGLGMGGEYPLASTHTAKNSDKGQASRNVALLYLFGSGFGQALCPTVVWITLACGANDEFTWRFMFAFAAFLALLGLILRYYTTSNDEAHEGEESERRDRRIQPGKLRVFWRPLLGAAIGWFMYDLVEYGLKSNDTDLFGGGAATHLAQARGVALNRYTQVPFLAVAAMVLACINTKTSQCIGFLGCGVICAILAADYQHLHDGNGPVFFVLYMLQLAFQAFCGTTTLAIPSQVFPSSFVGTGAGIAAATGKIGATIGTYLFSAWAGGEHWTLIFSTCVGTCICGLLVTISAVPAYGGEKLKVMEKLAAAGDEAAAVRSLYRALDQVAASENSKQPFV